MNVIELDQRSDAWLAWRNHGVTASQIAVIMNRSPYMTRWRLWAEKVGKVAPEDLSKNPNVCRGIRYEDRARQHYERKHDEILLPVCAESSTNPLFRASLDGLTSIDIPVELKAPSLSVMTDVLENGQQSEAYQLYWHQVQHQIYVVDADTGVLCFYFENEDTGEILWREFPIARDPEFVRTMIAEGEAFWELVKNQRAPAKDPGRDEFVPETLPDIRAWRQSASAWLERYEKVKQLEDQIATLKSEMSVEQKGLIDLMGGFVRANAFGVQITRYQSQGTIDWEKACEQLLPNIDPTQLDRFRRKPSSRVRMTPSSEESKKAATAQAKVAIADAQAASPDEDEGVFAW